MDIIIDLIILSTLFLIQASFVLYVAGPLILLKPTRRTTNWYAQRTTLLHPSDAQLPSELITFDTFDGFTLHGWFIPHSHPKGTIIYLHGVGDCKIGGLPFAQHFWQNGFSIFLFDLRAHGESEGLYCTYGFYEKHDVVTAITYLYSRNDIVLGNIGVFGTSMGGAVAIQAAAIDQRIAAVVSEGSFTALRTIFVDYQKRIIKLPWHFLRNVALAQSQRLANFKARLVSPLEDLKHVHCPILIAHGKRDSLIKVDYAYMLYNAANDPKELYIVEDANHSDVWEVGGTEYANTLTSFFERHLHQHRT
ncbi:MAG: alpha/beta fold hydrolase [Bacteroidetes bacterium]|nr:alpha/beta fold hydrolase [Bacteroidota bacterium]